jgi:hypothetical protein
VRLKNRIGRLERQARELRCAWCAFSIYDITPPLPFLPNREIPEVRVYACCWRCGTRFNVCGDSLRERQVYALFYSIRPAQLYTEERARAVLAYIVNRYLLARKAVADEAEDEGGNRQAHHWKQGKRRRAAEQARVVLSPKARARAVLYQRTMAQSNAEHEKLQKLFGDAPRDMDGKTFVELETIIFGDASEEALALDLATAQATNDGPQAGDTNKSSGDVA